MSAFVSWTEVSLESDADIHGSFCIRAGLRLERSYMNHPIPVTGGTDITRPRSPPNQVICSKILAKKEKSIQKWRSLVFSQTNLCGYPELADTKYLAYQTSVEPRCSIDSVADRVAQMASLVCRAMHFTEISLAEVARNLAIARRCLSVDTGFLKNSFVLWAGWVKSLSEGRLILRVPLTAPAQGTKASLETRFRALMTSKQRLGYHAPFSYLDIPMPGAHAPPFG